MEKNLTKILVDQYGISLARIAVYAGCDATAPYKWYAGITKQPRWYYQRKLEQLLAQQRRAEERKANP